MQELLSADRRTRGTYSASNRIWLSSDGTIDRTAIVKGSGNPAIDQAIGAVLSGGHLDQMSPASWPNPATLRIESHR